MRLKQISASIFTAAIIAVASSGSSAYTESAVVTADASQSPAADAGSTSQTSATAAPERAPDTTTVYEAPVTASAPVTSVPEAVSTSASAASTSNTSVNTASTTASSSADKQTSSAPVNTSAATTEPSATVKPATKPATKPAAAEPTTTSAVTAVPVPELSATEITRANFTDGVLNVKWKSVDCDGYNVLYRVRGTNSWSYAAEGTKLTELTYKGLKADTCYEIAVQPIRTDGTGKTVCGKLSAKDAMNHTAVNYADAKAIWIPCFTLEAMMKGRTSAQFTQEFSAACRNAKELGINTLYVHTRAFSDAFYQSEIFPWSRFCSGTVGVSPGYDPLKIMTDIAHKHGLSIHAWINPYRADTPKNLGITPESSPVKKWYSDKAGFKQYVNYADTYGTCWLNPGSPAVRELIAKGAEEIVSHYPVDGIHIDDYFYPTTDASFDSLAYSEYGGGKSLSDWRLANCTETVKGLYNTVKSANPSALFGISPQGNYENNYNYMYADVAKWLANSGYCDYIAPQIYFGYENKWKPFRQTVEFWLSLPRAKSVSMYIGIAPANLWLVSEFEEDTGIIGSQIGDSFACGASGVALYSYESLFMPPSDRKQRADDEIKAIQAALKRS